MLQVLVMGLLKNWRETTAYAGDEDFVFASDRLKGKQPRGREFGSLPQSSRSGCYRSRDCGGFAGSA